MADPAAIKKRELLPELHIPYVRHVDYRTIALRSGALMTMIGLEGVSFETADVDELNALHRALNTLYRNIADERLGIWTHIIRRRAADYPEGHFTNGFATGLDARYRDRMVHEELFRNDLYITLVWRAGVGVANRAGALLSGLRKARRDGAEADMEALRKLHGVTIDVLAGLKRYEPRVLGLYETEGVVFSEPSGVLHQLAGGRHEPVPLTMGQIASAIYSDRVIFGRETAEIRHEGASRFAGVYGLKEYPAHTRPGLLNGLLTVPFELALSQSFGFVAKSDAMTIMGRKQNQMISAGDKASSQIEELHQGLDDLESNRFVLGEHHLSVAVYASSTKELIERMAKCRAHLTSGGAVVAREDLGLESAWWAQLPGNFKYRARSGHITSRNFAALSPFHGYPVGQKDGNVWGPAVAMLKTASGSPFYLNFHHGDLGNTLVCGPSGSGKTVILNFLLAQAARHDPDIVLFDKDRGAEIFVRAMGGAYLPLRNGRPTGCAPLKGIEISPASKVFLAQWVAKLVGGAAGGLSAGDHRGIAEAIDGLADLPREKRTIGALRAFLDNTASEGIAAKLRRWERGKRSAGCSTTMRTISASTPDSSATT